MRFKHTNSIFDRLNKRVVVEVTHFSLVKGNIGFYTDLSCFQASLGEENLDGHLPRVGKHWQPEFAAGYRKQRPRVAARVPEASSCEYEDTLRNRAA